MLLLVLIVNVAVVFCSVTKLNILHITEEENTIAEIGLNDTLSRLKGKYNLKKVSGSNQHYEQFLTTLCSTYEEMLNEGTPPHLIIDTTLFDMTSLSVKSFSAIMDIPTVSTSYGIEGDLGIWDDITNYQRRNLIHFNTPNELIPEIVRSVVVLQGYSTAAVLVDDYYKIEHKYKSLLENVATRHIIAYINKTHSIQQLISIKTNNIFNIFVVGGLKHIKIILDSADAINMFTEKFSWHAITHERGNLQCECRKAKVFFSQTELIKSGDTQTEVSLKFYSYLTHQVFNATMKMYNNVDYTNGSYIKCEDYDGSNSPNRTALDLREYILNEISTNPNSKFKLSTENSITMDFTMSLYMITFREGTTFHNEPIGTWNAGFDSKMNITKPQVLSAQASRIVYRIITRPYPPFIYEDPKAKNGYSGYCIDLINEIAKAMVFDYQILTVIDNEMGRKGRDGKWNGMINELIAKRADIALSALSVTAEREEVIDYTVPYYEVIGHSIVMKLHKSSSSLFRFMQVLDSGVWYAIIGIYFATSFYMWFLYKLSPYGEKFVKSKETKVRDFNLLECLWFSITSITSMGGGEAPVNSSSRTLAAIWWFFSFVMFSSYCANLAAFLTVSRFESPIDDLQGLVEQYEITYSTLNDSDTMRYFQRMAEIESRLFHKWQDMNIYDNTMSAYDRAQLGVFEYPLSDRFTRIWKNMKSVGFVPTIKEGLKKVRKSPSPGKGFAFMLDSINAQYLALTNCDIEVVDEFFKRPMALAVQQGSYLKDQLNSVILDLSNKRVLAKLKEKWWTNNPHRKTCQNEEEVDGVDLDNIGGVFIYLGSAILLIVIISVVNYIIERRKRNKVIIIAPKNNSDEDI